MLNELSGSEWLLATAAQAFRSLTDEGRKVAKRLGGRETLDEEELERETLTVGMTSLDRSCIGGWHDTGDRPGSEQLSCGERECLAGSNAP